MAIQLQHGESGFCYLASAGALKISAGFSQLSGSQLASGNNESQPRRCWPKALQPGHQRLALMAGERRSGING